MKFAMEVDAEPNEKSLEELPMQTWNYGMRRAKQQILPNVYLGPYQAASKSQLLELKEEGITHILCIRQSIEAKCVKVNFPDDFKYKVIEFRDHPYESIIQHFPEARNFVDECLASGGKVLVHGVNGISRSAAIIIAYIMEKYNMSYEEAFQVVRKRRYCVDPNYGFRSQLQEYEPIYKARNMQSAWSNDGEIRTNFKRRRASDEEDGIGTDCNENFKKSA